MTVQISKDTMIKICKYGTYYNPAYNHYGSETNVMCDRCRKDNLDICVGWQSHDLCLPCVITVNSETKSPVTIPPPTICVTMMTQNQFQNQNKPPPTPTYPTGFSTGFSFGHGFSSAPTSTSTSNSGSNTGFCFGSTPAPGFGSNTGFTPTTRMMSSQFHK
jgi:hypothetical protein